jgi:hypothetical protein
MFNIRGSTPSSGCLMQKIGDCNPENMGSSELVKWRRIQVTYSFIARGELF